MQRVTVFSTDGRRRTIRGYGRGSAGADVLVQGPRMNGVVHAQPGHMPVAVLTPRIEDFKRVEPSGTARHGLVPATFEIRRGAQPPIEPQDPRSDYLYGLYDLNARVPTLLSTLPVDSVNVNATHVLAWRPGPRWTPRRSMSEPLIVSTESGRAATFGIYAGLVQAFWESPEKVLVSIMNPAYGGYGDDPRSVSWLLRLGTDGSIERVAGPVAGRIVLPSREPEGPYH